MKKIDETYSINTQGAVLNVKRGKELKHSIMNTGYVRVTLYGKTKALHRLLAIAFIPNPDNHPVVNHIDGNKTNNNLDNLEWCSISYNQKHAYANKLRLPSGGSSGGVKHPRSKFNEQDILDIKELKKTHTNKQIAEQYDCHTSIIQRITSGKSYK